MTAPPMDASEDPAEAPPTRDAERAPRLRGWQSRARLYPTLGSPIRVSPRTSQTKNFALAPDPISQDGDRPLSPEGESAAGDIPPHTHRLGDLEGIENFLLAHGLDL